MKKETEEVTEWKRKRPYGCDQSLEKHLDNVDLIDIVGAGSAR